MTDSPHKTLRAKAEAMIETWQTCMRLMPGLFTGAAQEDMAKVAEAYLEAVAVLEKYTDYRSHKAVPGDHSLPEDILLVMYKVIDQADGVNRGGWKES